MNRVETIWRSALGGAVCGGFLGIFAGGLLGAAIGTFLGNIGLGLDGAIAGGTILVLAGAIYGATAYDRPRSFHPGRRERCGASGEQTVSCGSTSQGLRR